MAKLTLTKILIRSAIVLVPLTMLGASVAPRIIFTVRNYDGTYQRRAMENFQQFAAGVPNMTATSCVSQDTDAPGEDGHGYVSCTGTIINPQTQDATFKSFECSIRPNSGCRQTTEEQLNGAVVVPRGN